jgi:8-oxo-dGTP pyrophosphatase MutT (NUDIX family)
MNMAANKKDPFTSSAAFRAVCSAFPPPGLQVISKEVPNPKPAAIMVPVVETVDGLAAIVTRRHANMRLHSNHWVFPGGRVDPEDASSAHAAIRETSEELGIDPVAMELLGQLNTRGPIITGYIIDVFVALVSSHAQLRPPASEVAAVDTVLLSAMCQPENSFRRVVTLLDDPGPTVIESPPDWAAPALHFVIKPGAALWGLQADILAELLQHLRGGPLAHLAR